LGPVSHGSCEAWVNCSVGQVSHGSHGTRANRSVSQVSQVKLGSITHWVQWVMVHVERGSTA